MKIIKTTTFNAIITLGLELGYTKKPYSKDEIVKMLQNYQKKRIEAANIHLSASVSECQIVLNGQNEKHLKLEFINYPKFPLELQLFKSEIMNLGTHLMSKMKQNRTVIVFSDETVMLEINDTVDPRI